MTLNESHGFDGVNSGPAAVPGGSDDPVMNSVLRGCWKIDGSHWWSFLWFRVRFSYYLATQALAWQLGVGKVPEDVPPKTRAFG